jgi:hypothetical protein
VSRADWIAIAVRTLLAWIALSALGILLAKALGDSLLPLLEVVIRLVTQDYAPALKLLPEQHDIQIVLSGLVMRPLHLTESLAIPPGTELTAQTHLLHTLVPAVIELTAVFAWPVSGWPERLVGILLGIVTAIAVIAVSAPFVLIGTIEISLQEWVATSGGQRPEPWALTWMLFCEMGGRWLLAVLAAIASIQTAKALIAHRMSKPPKTTSEKA